MPQHVMYFVLSSSETSCDQNPGHTRNKKWIRHKTEIINFNFKFPRIAETHKVLFPCQATVESSDVKKFA